MNGLLMLYYWVSGIPRCFGLVIHQQLRMWNYPIFRQIALWWMLHNIINCNLDECCIIYEICISYKASCVNIWGSTIYGAFATSIYKPNRRIIAYPMTNLITIRSLELNYRNLQNPHQKRETFSGWYCKKNIFVIFFIYE